MLGFTSRVNTNGVVNTNVVDWNVVDMSLEPADINAFSHLVQPIMAQGEQLMGTFRGSFKGTGDGGVVFTNLRVMVIIDEISIHVAFGQQRQVEVTSAPYKNIQAFSVQATDGSQTSSTLEMKIHDIGLLRFSFAAGSNVADVCRVISEFTLH